MTTSSHRDGRIWFRVLLITAGAAIVVMSLLYLLTQMRRATQCAAQLQSIYRALELYEMDRGTLPTLAYFPDLPMEDADSLRVALEPYGLAPDRCICPQSKPIQRAEGLTYLWNVQLNGQRLPRGADAVWMLVDMNALSDDVPAPHLGRYNALFSDGSVRRIRNPRRELPGL